MNYVDALRIRTDGRPRGVQFANRVGLVAAVFLTMAAPALAGGSLRINEIVALNGSSAQDELGDTDDWVEIWNGGASTVDLGGHFVADSNMTPWQIPTGSPETVLAPGGRLLLWFDGETDEGPRHVEPRLGGDGDTVLLYATDGTTVIDSVSFGQQYEDVSLMRNPDGIGTFALSTTPTPNTPNVLTAPVFGCTDPQALNYDPLATLDDGSCTYDTSQIPLFINEFVASNTSGIQDELGQFEDWVEIWNPGPGTVSLSGVALTDDLTDPQQWAFPDSTIAAGEFRIIWCDGEPEQGPWHASFRLSAAGEEIAMFDAQSGLIDSRVFGPQTEDVSEGREMDGDPTWTTFATPTPGASNHAVPVVLADTHLAYADGNVSIAWRTSFESNHAGFRIERRAVGNERGVLLDGGLIDAPDADGWYRAVDADIEVGDRYGYTLIAIDRSGDEERFDLGTIVAARTAPVRPRLAAPHPNPLQPSTRIAFDLPAATSIDLRIVDATGRTVRQLVTERAAAGRHTLVWDGLDDRTRRVASGLYFVRLAAGSVVTTQKLMVVW